jgi:60 kDa SS-A/Ro ribonucleoprotein
MNYLQNYGTRIAPQSQPIPGSDQVENSAGGFAWAVDKWTRLNRFLILGSEGGSYYASEQSLTKANADSVVECVKEDGLRAVSVICDISKEGRAPKNDPAIFALAIAASLGDDKTRKAALEALPEVCRIGTHLFHFAQYVEQFRGWGRGLRKAVAAWYQDKPLDDLAYQLIKYRQRDGWSHRDLLRLAHPATDTQERSALLRWATGKGEWTGQVDPKLDGISMPESVKGFMAAQNATSSEVTAGLVRKFRLPREALQTEHLNDPEVWRAMLDTGMPMTALIRNLATMTRIGLLSAGSTEAAGVASWITNEDLLRKARIHPIAVLAALKTYEAGRSARGKGEWTPVPQIVDALDEAFYLSFGNVEPTGKSRLIALDVSGSMFGGEVAGIPGLTPAVASAAMAMVTVHTGDPYEVVAFTNDRGLGGYYRQRGNAPREIFPGLSAMTLSKRQRLDDIVKVIQNEYAPFMGGTDCSLPMQYAEAQSKQYDAIEVYTDSETWAGRIHPAQALQSYRQKSGRDTKLIVVGMVSNGFSIADPNDAGMLDVVGFDTSTPNLMSAFIQGGF